VSAGVAERFGKLVVVGVGLIGGSCALALRRVHAVERVVGVGRSRENLDLAITRGIVDVAHTLGDDWTRELADADVVLLATPVAQLPGLFDAIAPALGASTVVTDAGSTKQDVVLAAERRLGARLPAFVPGHPIAGSETSGAAAACATLFDGRSVLLTPLAITARDATARVSSLWRACGSHVTTMSAAEHDRIFAAVSHLPHVIAFALVAELAGRKEGEAIMAHGGTGFRDFTRIAGSSPAMWRDIALANRDALLDESRQFRQALADVERLIAAGDGMALAALFDRAARARRAWGATFADDGDAA